MHRFQTTAVHAGREDFGDLCVHAPPLDLSTTYPIADLDVGSASFDALVGGNASAANVDDGLALVDAAGGALAALLVEIDRLPADTLRGR